MKHVFGETGLYYSSSMEAFSVLQLNKFAWNEIEDVVYMGIVSSLFGTLETCTRELHYSAVCRVSIELLSDTF